MAIRAVAFDIGGDHEPTGAMVTGEVVAKRPPSKMVSSPAITSMVTECLVGSITVPTRPLTVVRVRADARSPCGDRRCER